jgi:hypothetical protein
MKPGWGERILELLAKEGYSQPDQDAMDNAYISVRYSIPCAKALFNHVKSLNLPPSVRKIDPSEYHTTIVNSDTPISNYPLLGILAHPYALEDTERSWELLGKDEDTKFLTLRFNSLLLTTRHQLALMCGATTQWPDFKAHISVAMEVPSDYDISTIPPYTGPLDIIEEQLSPVDKNFSEKIKTTSSVLAALQSIPKDSKLWNTAQQRAKVLFDRESPLKQQWVIKWYNSKGGTWS